MHGWWPCVEDPNLFWNKIYRYWITWADRIYRFTPYGTLPKQRLQFVHRQLVRFCITHRIMSKRNTYIAGTLRGDRKRNPSQIVEKKLRKGEMVFMSLGDVSVIKWKDKRDVCVISNAHVPIVMDSVNRHGKSKRKPNVVHIYNNHMLEIDRSDQLLSYHSVLRKTIRWYKKVGIHIMEIFLSNAYYMYAKNTTNPIAKNMKDFRESIVTNLIGPPPPNHHLKPQASFHHLSTIPRTEKKKNVARICKHCSKNQSRRESRYECHVRPNKPALCVDPCFKHHQVLRTNNLPSSKAFCIL